MLKATLRHLWARFTLAAMTRLVSLLLTLKTLPLRLRVALHGDVLELSQLRDVSTGIFCIFHIYPVGRLPASTWRVLDALAARGINIVAVVNGRLHRDDLPRITSLAHTLIHRVNWGRDFGGYRRGVLHVLEHHQPSRLILLNDSVFYASPGLAALVEALAEPHPFSGAAENHQHQYHVGSFALGFGPEVFNDPRFLSFWQRYRLTNLRPEVIRHGEMALTRLLVERMRIAPYVIYSPARLSEALARLSAVELVTLASRLPQSFTSVSLLRAVSHAMPGHTTLAGARWHDAVRHITLTSTFPATESEKLKSDQLRQALESEIIEYVFEHSQIHRGAYVLARCMACPIVKKDLFLRGFFRIGELGVFRDVMPESEYDELFSALTERGDPRRHWSFKRRILFQTSHL